MNTFTAAMSAGLFWNTTPEDEALAQGDALDAVGRGDRMHHVGLALAVVVGVADDARRGIGREWEQCRQYGG